MRIIKIVLILLLVIITGLYGATMIYLRVTGVNEGPTIGCGEEILEVSVGQPEEDLLTGVTASDAQDGDLTDRIIVGGVSKLITNDTAKVTYLVFDSDNNMASCVRYIRYTDYRLPTLQVMSPLRFSSADTAALVKNLKATDVIDGDISDSIRISTMSATDDSSVYSIVAQVTNSMGDTARAELPVIVMESDAARPVIVLTEQLVYLEAGSEFDAQSYVSSLTVSGSSVSTGAVNTEHEVDTQTPGTYWVYYRYSSGGLTGLAILTVIVQ